MGTRQAAAIDTIVAPTAADLDGVVRALQRGWTATLVVRRQSPDDVGYREVFVRLDGQPVTMLSYGNSVSREIEPGRHTLQVDNTLFRKSLVFTAGVGERLSFTTANRAGWGTYSPLALLIGFLGAGPFYLSLEREGTPAGTPAAEARDAGWTRNS